METKFRIFLSALVVLATSTHTVAVNAQVLAKEIKVQEYNFKEEGKTAYSIWPVIPFFPLGDIGQYEKTMSQERDSVRKMFWEELTTELNELADKGVAVEAMLEPLANILMMFDQVHDTHKAKDVVNIDKSIEAQFKSRLDQLFQHYDVRDDHRKIQISGGVNETLLHAQISQLADKVALGKKASKNTIQQQMTMEMFNQIDYVSYGTFSSLGRGNFQLTYHLTGYKNGLTRSFIAKGSLTGALDDLAQQVFDFFQKNVYPDWETPHLQLSWLPKPVNHKKYAGYTWNEANAYCKLRGYRLPYAREMLMAESGGAYKEGGIGALDIETSYSVADKRLANVNYVLTPGNEAASGGAIQGASHSMTKGQFWCVKGKVSDDVKFFENLWSLIRKYQQKDAEIYRALETVRYELGDFGATENIFMPETKELVTKMDSLEETLKFLKSKGIKISIPESLK